MLKILGSKMPNLGNLSCVSDSWYIIETSEKSKDARLSGNGIDDTSNDEIDGPFDEMQGKTG